MKIYKNIIGRENKMNILLIEDNITIIKGLKYSFEKNNYNLIYKTTINDAKIYLKDNSNSKWKL